MTKRKAKTGEATAEMRMLAAMVESGVYEDFAQVAKSHERTVAAELRVLVRTHIKQHSVAA